MTLFGWGQNGRINVLCQRSFKDFAAEHPMEGMPLAIAGLTDEEYAQMMGWLKQGAHVAVSPVILTDAELDEIQHWENLLNQPDHRHQLVARWLYEHLFLAHLYFETPSPAPRFFELVRSYTPSGEPLKPVSTRLPNQDPEKPFYYRLRPVTGSIVHKRHITLDFSRQTRERVKTLFFSEAWSVDALPGYDYSHRANPFMTFAAIPARAKYQFMLDNAQYFTRTFIRGPVCRGQIATDVIRDHFWVLYQDPDKDLFVTDADYRSRVSPLLGLPGQDDDLLEAGTNWDKYRDQRNRYQDHRQRAYREFAPDWASIQSIWDGEGYNKNALLTVFRHFDSASVQQGLVGRVPQTIWWMDYPLFERSYYELVVNFDVFGNVAHQLQTRLYFDLIRNGAEHNFLRLLPANERRSLLDDWYQGMGAIKTHISYAALDEQTRSADAYENKDKPSKKILANRLFAEFNAINAQDNDVLNRCFGHDCFRPLQPEWIQQTDVRLAGISSISSPALPGLRYLPEITFLRVRSDDMRTVYSLIRNRAHSNVAFLFGESLRRQPEADYLTVYPGIAGSYPNFIFDIPADEVGQFTLALKQADNETKFEQMVLRWGVRRTHPDFWKIFHDFTQWQREQQPLEAGIFDANRYENL
ncbi:fatty acid cis/trans isomerase [Methylophaga frappieri]|uniref:fatty acid cis/trans isomerase n=1 Tax=Methylophaga frappieri (strain ATCC BAA-2434 / DSM 25690 / JAM7) TaxID=754477 RepID=UPI001EE677B3|nr:fatty acid cis/trans isomerase [Methylophaga frappieri]